MQKQVELRWDLDTLYAGGADSQAFRRFVALLEADLSGALEQLRAMEPPRPVEDSSALFRMIAVLGDLQARFEEASAFANALLHQNTADPQAAKLQRQRGKWQSQLNKLFLEWDRLSLQIPDAIFQDLMQEERIGTQAFYLQERRKQAASLLAPEVEAVLQDVASQNAKAWARLRQNLMSRVRFTLEIDGQPKTITAGPAFHLLFTSHSDLAVRKTLPAQLRAALEPDAELYAAALNQIIRIRMQTQKHRGWTNPLQDTLHQNRVSEQSLQAMFQVLDANLARFVPFYQRKARLLGLEQLREEDLLAPMGESRSTVRYEDGIERIAGELGRFHPQMAEFVREAADKRWIEAEVRPDKSTLIYCTYFPVSQQPRVFTTFRGSFGCVTTLAHELGHAYHHHSLGHQPPLAQQVPLSMAEIASTFSEMLVTNGCLRPITDGAEKAHLLNEKFRNIVMYVLKPYVNFLFEKRLCEACPDDLLTAAQLDEQMVEIQQFVYQDSLASYSPLHWISNNLFYLTERPFYNYQYTFGYLFSAGLYSLAMEQKTMSPEQYDALLQDTGCMTVEELAQKHLGVDLTQPAFWQGAVELLVKGLREFGSFLKIYK